MPVRSTIQMTIGSVLVLLTLFAGEMADAEVTRTQIEVWDNWGWQGGPQSSARIICPGGELAGIPLPCSDSKTGRVHVRDGAAWSCVTSDDPRMTGLGFFTSNINFDAAANGRSWGGFKIIPMVGCNKDANYAEEYEGLVTSATRFWQGTWNGERRFDSALNAWITELKIVAKGFGEDLDGLHFKGTEWITTLTPFPLPYEYIFPYGSPEFDMPEAYMIGTIKD